MKYRTIKISDHTELIDRASKWFHDKWNVPLEAYMESMRECQKSEKPIPEWYLAMENDEIIGGLGVIENDFHARRDLTPNVCAVYVEEDKRNMGIAGELLQFVCDDMKSKGIDKLYLVTDHTSFYERYGWEFLCMVKCDDGNDSRMYVHN